MELEAANGQRVLAYLVFGHALRYFKDSCLKAVNESFVGGGTAVTAEDVQWVITVPAIWRQSAKQFMRYAATEVSRHAVELCIVLFVCMFVQRVLGSLGLSCKLQALLAKKTL